MRILYKLIFFFVLLMGSGFAFAETPHESYIRAKALLDAQPEEAYSILKKVKFTYADDMRLGLLADASMRTTRIEEAASYLQQYAKKAPSQNESIRAQIERVELLMLIGKLEIAKKEVKSLIKNLRKANWKRANRWHFSARALRLHHDLETGESQRAIAKKLLLTYPTESPTRSIGLAFSIKELTNAERFRRALQLMKGWEYHEARSEFERLKEMKAYKYTSLWNLGVIGLRKLRDRPEEAEKIFSKLSRTKNTYQERATWYWARSLMKQNRYKDAFRVFDRYENNFPSGSKIGMLYYYRGWLPYDARENKKAIRGLKAFIKKFGKSGRRSTFIYGFLGWAYMREKQWDNAIGVWDQMQSFGNALVAGKALYWKAVAQQEKGDKDAAVKTLIRIRSRYSLTYYGLLAEQFRNKLEGKSTKASEVWWPKRPKIIEDQPKRIATAYRFSGLDKGTILAWKRVKELVSLEEHQRARETLKPIYKTLVGAVGDKNKKSFIHALGWFVQNFNAMWRASAGKISAMPRFPIQDTLSMVMAYPRAYKDIVQNVSNEFGIPDYFMWSIMRQESRYKPSAISYTDAVGALQMIPKTARKVAPDIGTEYELRTFSNPAVGFRFSGFYMRKILDYFDGHFVFGAASYNTGPAVISRWFHKNKEADFPSLIEEFEYNEGRSYSRKVTEHMLRYIYLYENDDAQRKVLLDKMFPRTRDFSVPLPEEIDY